MKTSWWFDDHPSPKQSLDIIAGRMEINISNTETSQVMHEPNRPQSSNPQRATEKRLKV
jgi:hypothetical protein